MLKNIFSSQTEFNIYIAEQKVRKENKGLTVSERKQLEEMIKTPNNYIKEIKEIPQGCKIITDINKLCHPSELVTKEDDIKFIIKNLKETLEYKKCLGLTANQIGINKKISYIKIPKFFDQKSMKWNYNEYILINTKIIEKDRPIKVTNETCVSFPNVPVTTRRYVFITVEYLNEKMKPQAMAYQDLEALAIQHECDHQNGLTIFDRKWRK